MVQETVNLSIDIGIEKASQALKSLIHNTQLGEEEKSLQCNHWN